jgi:putative isomerase
MTQVLQAKIDDKLEDVQSLYNNHYLTFMRGEYLQLADKCYLTLQNNWRTPAGELKHSGVFPSYHYEWFHGFWAWDSWKHAAALAIFDTEKAKDQVRAMYDFMQDDGFIPDCVYRDTTLEKHNYRNTKAPLSAWAVWSIYKRDRDTLFLKEMYPKLVKQHNWWYKNRDHDQDGICEYGSTDGTLIAAKWESGMDNAVRFDSSAILKNHEGAYSLNQESVDLNAYLAAEKIYLGRIAETLTQSDFMDWKDQAKALQSQIELQFFDAETGWFYDTNLNGTKFIKVMGCEGWIPLWSGSANYEQATRVKENMMLPSKFNDSIPLQTLSADHPKFKPDGGYWRGPVWLDQAYFGIQGLHNYSFRTEAFDLSYKIIHNSEGLLEKGPSIRENYNPLNGAGMEAQNFSWSAAHLLMIMGNL